MSEKYISRCVLYSNSEFKTCKCDNRTQHRFSLKRRSICSSNILYSSQDALNAISGATALVNKYLKKVAEKAGIQKNISTHTGRHTFAYLMVAKNVNPFIMKELLGHSDIRVTQIYAKASKANKDKAIDSLDDLNDLLDN